MTMIPALSYNEWIMCSNEIETNDVNGSQLAEQGEVFSAGEHWSLSFESCH